MAGETVITVVGYVDRTNCVTSHATWPENSSRPPGITGWPPGITGWPPGITGWPLGDHRLAAPSKNYRYSTNVQIAIDAETRLRAATH